MKNQRSLGFRAKRYAKVGAAVGGLAARVAGQRYLGMEFNRLEHATDLKDALGGLKGPLMKVAQILSTIPNALPKEYAAQLGELQSNAPSMGWHFVRRRMVAELGPDWETHFLEFSKTASAAASLGQVHKAVCLDGKKVACKLQYPDMTSVVDTDLRQLKLVFSIYRRYDRAVNPTQIYDELSERLREELDYKRECSNMNLYHMIFENENSVNVPFPLAKLCTDRLLTMSWLDGEPLLSFISNNPGVKIRNKIALNMFRAWYVPFYYYGIIHGDPHLGNYSIRPDGTINLLDFGCIRVFRPSFVTGVIDLYKALRDNDFDLAVKAYETWGFKNLSKELIGVLNIWAEFVYAPLLENRVRPIQEHENYYGASIAQKVRQELNRCGGITPPPEFVLMDRAAIGLGSVFMHLKAKINWHSLFHDLIDDFDEVKVSERQQNVLTLSAESLKNVEA